MRLVHEPEGIRIVESDGTPLLVDAIFDSEEAALAMIDLANEVLNRVYHAMQAQATGESSGGDGRFQPKPQPKGTRR